MRIFKLKLFVFAIAIGIGCTPALANFTDEINQTGYQREFKLLDVDSSGKLDSGEIKKDELFDGGGFGKADKNRDGGLNQDEFSTHKSDVQAKESKRIARDSAITTKVKSKYLLEKKFKSFKVSVETKDGVVILSGFVDDQATKTRAEQIARSVKGVKSVTNGLVVKP